MAPSKLNQRLSRLTKAFARYGPIFLVEVVVFWLVVEAVNVSGYGGSDVGDTVDLEFFASMVIVVLAMGAGEARFHLYRRVWSVAGLNDAFAVGLAVVEASLLVTIVNLSFPDGSRPFRVLAPILATPAVVIAIGLVRLVPRLRSSVRQAGNRLLVVIPDATGYRTVKALVEHPNPDWTPVAIVTTGAADVGQTLMGVPVLGQADDLKRWLRSDAAPGGRLCAHDCIGPCARAPPLLGVPGRAASCLHLAFGRRMVPALHGRATASAVRRVTSWAATSARSISRLPPARWRTGRSSSPVRPVRSARALPPHCGHGATAPRPRRYQRERAVRCG